MGQPRPAVASFGHPFSITPAWQARSVSIGPWKCLLHHNAHISAVLQPCRPTANCMGELVPETNSADVIAAGVMEARGINARLKIQRGYSMQTSAYMTSSPHIVRDLRSEHWRHIQIGWLKTWHIFFVRLNFITYWQLFKHFTVRIMRKFVIIAYCH